MLISVVIIYCKYECVTRGNKCPRGSSETLSTDCLPYHFITELNYKEVKCVLIFASEEFLNVSANRFVYLIIY